jgi:hypothetical protein
MARETPSLSEAHLDLLAELYRACGRSRDALPYTPEFDALHLEFVVRTGTRIDRHQLWRVLSALGKRGKLPREDSHGEA